MYKIYINDNKIELIPSKNISSDPVDETKVLLARYNGKQSHLLSFIDMAEKTNRYEQIIIHSNDVDGLIHDFEDLFKTVEAAGGLVVGGCLEMVLQVTRGIGNHDLEPGFTPEPHISEPIFLERKTKFLVLSSDGIFDKVTDEEAVRYVNRELTMNGLKNCSISLGNLALRRGALYDLSCIVLSLR